MTRKIAMISICLIFIISLQCSATSTDTTFNLFNDFIKEKYNVNKYYKSSNIKGESFNPSVLKEYQMISFGSVSGGKFSSITNRLEPRYLGSNPIAQLIPNYNYAYDSKSNIFFDDMKWITNPWDSPRVCEDSRYNWIQDTPFNAYRSDPLILKSFLSGMHLQHGNPDRPSGDWFRGDPYNSRGEALNWERYMHIIDPPTEWTHGSAMLWHVSALDGQLYYIDVRLTRFMDLVGRLQVKHRTVSGQKLPDYDYERVLKDGETIHLSALDIPGYVIKGYGISASSGTAPLQTSGGDFSLTYDYGHERRLYTLTYYYDVPVKDHLITLPIETTGAIRIGSNVFDVNLGIPTGESVWVSADVTTPFFMDYSYERLSGSETLDVIVRQPYYRIGVPGSDGVSEGRFNVSRTYSYYQIKELYAYGLSHVNVHNDKISQSGVLSLSAQALAPNFRPLVDFQPMTSHVTPLAVEAPAGTSLEYSGVEGAYILTLPELGLTSTDIADFDLEAAAQSAVSDVQVRSDRLVLNGEVLMDASWHYGHAPSPLLASDSSALKRLKAPLQLRLSDVVIPHSASNGPSDTRGTVYFQPLALHGVAEQIPNTTLSGNGVMIHTPVVADAELHPLEAMDQRMEAASPSNDGTPTLPASPTLPALPLGVLTALDIGTQGMHLEIPGYGDQDYGRYAKWRRLYFPFDCFYSWSTSDDPASISQAPGPMDFIGGSHWLVVPSDAKRIYLRLPVWVNPGDYKLLYQVVSKNHRTPASHEIRANLNPANDIAGVELPVTVTGRLYDFTISESTEPIWRPFFADLASSVGGLKAQGLPLAPGSNTTLAMQTKAPKIGYVLRFHLKSLGPYFRPDDLIYIKPEFSHIDPVSGTHSEVDVYYRKDYNWVLVGSPQDSFRWHVPLQNGRRDLSIFALEKTAELLGALGQVSKADSWIETSLVSQYVAKVKSMALGDYRRLLGPLSNSASGYSMPAGSYTIAKEHQYAPSLVDYNSRFQTWYGEYLLPNSLLIKRRGTDQVLSRGFLAVNFTIGLYEGGQIQRVSLLYNKEWALEGQTPGPGRLGDIVYYQLESRASDDLK